jgi:hypothetical protein
MITLWKYPHFLGDLCPILPPQNAANKNVRAEVKAIPPIAQFLTLATVFFLLVVSYADLLNGKDS